jgi:Zn-dependent alcohol dehydrogenase
MNLLSEPFPLENINEALSSAKRGEKVRVLVEMNHL